MQRLNILIFSARAALFDHVDPALGSLYGAHLDSCKSVVKLLDNRTHLVHAVCEADLLAVIVDLTNRADNCCCSAKTHLNKLRNL